MTRSKRIAKKINEYITAWGKDHAKLVVAIDGYAGSGKTTVLDYLHQLNPEILPIHLDNFIEHWKKRKQMMEAAKDRSRVFEFKWYRYRELENLTRKFKEARIKKIKVRTYNFDKNDFNRPVSTDLSKKVLVIEGIFLFHSQHRISKLLDKKVYLNIDLDKADEMRVAREKKRWGKRYVPETHPESYVIPFKQAYRRYIKTQKPAKKADTVFKILN